MTDNRLLQTGKFRGFFPKEATNLTQLTSIREFIPDLRSIKGKSRAKVMMIIVKLLLLDMLKSDIDI